MKNILNILIVFTILILLSIGGIFIVLGVEKKAEREKTLITDTQGITC